MAMVNQKFVGMNDQKCIELGGTICKLNNVCTKNNEIIGIDGIVEFAAYPDYATPSSRDVDNPDMFVNLHVLVYMSMMSIGMKVVTKDGNEIDKKSVVIGDTADDNNKQPMIDFVHDACNMLHWETDDKSIKMMAKNVIEYGIKELLKKARYSVR